MIVCKVLSFYVEWKYKVSCTAQTRSLTLDYTGNA